MKQVNIQTDILKNILPNINLSTKTSARDNFESHISRLTNGKHHWITARVYNGNIKGEGETPRLRLAIPE